MTKAGTNVIDVDTFRVDLFTPKYEIIKNSITSTSNKDLIPEAGEYVYVNTELVNIGKGSGNVGIKATPLGDFAKSVYPGSPKWFFKLKDNYVTGSPLNFKIVLSYNGAAQDSMNVNLLESCIPVDLSKMHFISENDAISLYWDPMNGATRYNIYQSATENGTYTKLNKKPLTTRYYKDEDLNLAEEYYYKISTLNTSQIESPLSEAIKAWTVYPSMGVYPLKLYGANDEYVGEATTADFDYDGQKEIILMSRYNDSKEGRVVVVRPDGTEPYDIDGNITTFTGYAKIPWCKAEATPTVADIFGNGEPCIIAMTRNGSNINNNYIICYSSMDKNGDHLPDTLWTRQVNSSFYRSAVVTDINAQDGKGEKEIIVKDDGGELVIRIYDCRGNLKQTLGKGKLGGFYGGIAVADLNNDGYKEIICGNGPNLYIWKHDGTPYGNSPFFTRSGDNLASSPVVCDLNGDGNSEIIIATRNTSISKIYAIKQDGTCLPGFDGTTSIPYTNAQSSGIDHALAVGDITGDGNLEIVALGHGCVRAWSNTGNLLLNKSVPGLFPNTAWQTNLTTPILADVDGDSSIDIVFHERDKIYALHNDGTEIVGFPLTTSGVIYNGVSVSDIDNDGKNELVAGDSNGYIYAWKTNGNSNAIEWGRSRCNTENTGEYISGYRDQWVITSNVTWQGGMFTNDIIVRSGKFTISDNVLRLRSPYRIYVMDGGTLEIDDGSITNADIIVKNGGSIIIKNNGAIYLRSNGALNVEVNATADIPFGAVMIQ